MKKTVLFLSIFCCFFVYKTGAQTTPTNNYIKISGSFEPVDTISLKTSLFVKILDKSYYANYSYAVYTKTANELKKVITSNYCYDNNLSFVSKRNEDVIVILN